MFNTTLPERVPPVDPYRVHMESLELAGKTVVKHMTLDDSFPPLINRMRVTPQSGTTVSGLIEHDYPNVNGMSGLANVKQLRTLNKVPLPPEIMEHFGHMQCSCMMGIFPEINRAWLTIDSDIYIWNFENGSDVAYFDGLSETILSVGLVKPKSGIFQNYIRHLLVLSTTSEIIVLGVTFTSTNEGVTRTYNELHLTQEIIYTMTTDGVPITVITGTDKGRIFLGGKDGSLFEILYQIEIGWWGKRCKKVNHSTGTLSFLVPSFINAAFNEEDSIIQISVDNSRHILYTLSEKGTIEVFDLGENGTSTSRLASLSQSAIVQCAFSSVRTLESGNFRPVVSISAIEIWESAELGLVAVTESGVRLYFTTGPTGARPTTLHLTHVRLPPGFTANAPASRPNTVHMALYSSGNLLLVTSPGGNQDKIWCLSGDAFPLHPMLSEQQSILNLDGVVWAIKEVKVGVPPSLPLCEQPPLLVRQHYEPARKFVVLTPQGAEIIKNLRPVDVLSQLLCDSHGPESELVKCYFQNQSEDQACATCLLLACDQSSQNMQLSEWATRAFFLYGGDPRVGTTPLHHPSFQYPAGFNPSSVSTPLGNRSFYTPPDTTTIQYSSKHNGLYLYVSRVLRPLWNNRIVQKVVMNNKQYLVSSVQGDEVSLVAGRLLALRTFLEKNTQFGSGTQKTLYCDTLGTPTTTTQPQRSRLQEAQLQEKTSLDALKTLVDHSYQVLGLWKLMCEHQFHVIADSLSQEQQNQMVIAKFRDLILLGQELCSSLINKLINTYLSDNTSIDPISLKLRDICPKLYRNEDAVCTKANEMINLAKTKQNKDEKDRLLRASLNLCKDVAPRINLSAVCRQFVSCQYYEGVVELSLECAAKCDPKDLALNYYLNNQPVEDSAGYQAYAQRLDCYTEVTSVLDHLHHQSLANPYAPRIPISPGPQSPQSPQPVSVLEYFNKADDLVKLSMESSDQLLHIAIYDWMINKHLFGELIDVAKPSLEIYLKRASSNPDRRDASEFADLLWKYNERQGNHAAAAQILYSLAKEPSKTLNLSERITYLAKGVMCMRSDKVGCAPHLGIFLNDLEDLLQVAKIQKQVLSEVSNLVQLNEQAEQAVVTLNSCLLTITELYEEFADPYDLWECKLAIIDCSGHDDADLMRSIWMNIIGRELGKCPSTSPDEKMALVMRKVEELGGKYTVSSRCFPLGFLVFNLELICCRLRATCNHVHSGLIKIGVSLPVLFKVYNKLFVVNDRCWLNEGNEFYLIEAIASLAESFTANPKMAKQAERKSIAVLFQDLISSCLSTLYSRPDTKTLINHLRSVKLSLNTVCKKYQSGNVKNGDILKTEYLSG